MKKLTPRRRLAAFAGATAAAGGSFPLLFRHAAISQAIQGVLVGISLGVSITLLLRSRRTCLASKPSPPQNRITPSILP